MLALVGPETRLAASLARGTSRRTKKRTPERRTVRGDLSVRASQTRWTLDGADCPRAESGEILDESKSSQCPVRPIDITDYCEVRVGETSLMRGGSRVFFFFVADATPSPPPFSPASLLAFPKRVRRAREKRADDSGSRKSLCFATARAIRQTHDGHGFEMLDAKFEAKGDHLFVSNVAPASLKRDRKLFVSGVYSFLSELERHFFPGPGDDEHGVFVNGERVPVFGQWSLEPGSVLRIGEREWRVAKTEKKA